MIQRSSSLLLGVLLLSLPIIAPALAYLLPGDFVLRRAEEQWKGNPGLVLLREVRRKDAAEASSEQLYLKDGNVRLEVHDRVRLFPDDTISDEDRPLLIDALFLQPPGGLRAMTQKLGFPIDQVSLDRLPTPDAPLPFRVFYRLGTAERAGSPFLDIEKDRWYIRRIQFRATPDGPWWRAEYDGQGASKDLPAWLPTRIQVYRGGEPLELITVVRKLNTPIRDSHFSPRATPRKP